MAEPIRIFEIKPKEMTSDIMRATLTLGEINAIRDMKMYYGIDAEAEAARIAMVRNTAEFAQYETWAKIDAGCGVNVILHYGAPPICYPLELSYGDIFEFEMHDLFAGIFDANYLRDPFSFHSPHQQMMSRGMASIHSWTMQLFKSRFTDESWIDFGLLSQRLYVCFEQEDYDTVKHRVANTSSYDGRAQFPSAKYVEYINRRKYLILN